MAKMQDEALDKLIAQKAAHIEKYKRENAYRLFTPLKYQIDWFACRKKIRCLFSGNQVGKTEFLAISMLAGCLGAYPPGVSGKELPASFPATQVGPKRYLIVGESFTTTLPEAVIPKLLKYIRPDMLRAKPKRGSHGHPTLFQFKTGADLHLQSQEQGKEGFEGAIYDGVGIDEPPTQEIFNAIRRGTMATSGFIIIAGTPLKEPWMRDTIESAMNDASDPNHGLVEVFRVPIWANCEHSGGILPHQEIEAFLDSLPPKERAARESGEFADYSGIEFPYVTPDTHMVPDFF